MITAALLCHQPYTSCPPAKYRGYVRTAARVEAAVMIALLIVGILAMIGMHQPISHSLFQLGEKIGLPGASAMIAVAAFSVFSYAIGQYYFNKHKDPTDHTENRADFVHTLTAAKLKAGKPPEPVEPGKGDEYADFVHPLTATKPAEKGKLLDQQNTLTPEEQAKQDAYDAYMETLENKYSTTFNGLKQFTARKSKKG